MKMSHPLYGSLRAAALLIVAASTLPAQQVLFSRGSDSDAKPTATTVPDHPPSTPVTDTERCSVAITATDLDLHLTPATAGLEAHAVLTLRNVSNNPVSRIPVQLSSTLRWQSIAIDSGKGLKAAEFTQSPIATDADHTGYAEEAVIALPAPVQPGQTLKLTGLYAGAIQASAARLELLGTPADRAAQVDWDAIAPEGTALRGFGDVLWYPVAAPTALLGDANKLFAVIGAERLRSADLRATLHLRLAVEYVGEPPAVAILDGHTELLTRTDDTQDTAVAVTRGVATVDFGDRPIGFRSPSLFVTPQPAIDGADQLLSVFTGIAERAESFADAVALVHPLAMEWLGPTQSAPLTVLDHAGQTFEDDALLVTPLDPAANPDDLAPQAAYGLAHAWFHSAHPWLDEGVAQFLSLLWTERKQGRAAVVAELEHQATLVGLAEPDLSAQGAGSESSSLGDGGFGQPLIHTDSEVFYREKAAAVLWMLRGIVGDDTLKQALQAYRRAEGTSATYDDDPRAFQHTLEHAAKRDLAWFFDDWVNRDRSLPDLSIVDVVPHPLPARPGKSAGFLVAVEVRNDGDAVAEVPVTIRSGEFTATERLRIAAHATTATRILFEGVPDEVQVNDGTTPELRASLHTRQVQVKVE
jgi:hypothetical protein